MLINIKVLINNFQYLSMGFDTEHAHFLNINEKYLKSGISTPAIVSEKLKVICFKKDKE